MAVVRHGDCRAHRRLVDIVARKCSDKGYSKVAKNLEYMHNGQVLGECDVLTYRNGYFNYYEIKSRHHSKAYKKAKRQFDRWAMHHPDMNCRGIYVARTQYGRLVARRLD